nr:hypothetical protein CparaKRNrm1_p088 [Cryptomonas paramecium]
MIKKYSKFIKQKKIEKTNNSVTFFSEYTQRVDFLELEKKQNHFKFSFKKKNMCFWNKEKKIFYFGNESGFHNLFLDHKFCFYVEKYFNFKKKYKKKKSYTSSSYTQSFEILSRIHISIEKILLFTVLQNFMNVNRFNLSNSWSCDPHYIGQFKKKNLEITLSIFLAKKFFEFGFYIDVSVLFFKIKPIQLKLAYFGTTCFILFSVEIGFLINSPVYIKYRNLNFFSFFYSAYFFYQKYKLTFFR